MKRIMTEPKVSRRDEFAKTSQDWTRKLQQDIIMANAEKKSIINPIRAVTAKNNHPRNSNKELTKKSQRTSVDKTPKAKVPGKIFKKLNRIGLMDSPPITNGFSTIYKNKIYSIGNKKEISSADTSPTLKPNYDKLIKENETQKRTISEYTEQIAKLKYLLDTSYSDNKKLSEKLAACEKEKREIKSEFEKLGRQYKVEIREKERIISEKKIQEQMTRKLKDKLTVYLLFL